MEKYLDNFYNIIDKIGKHNFMLITFILVVLVITGFYQTFSLYTESEEKTVVDGVDTYSFILNPDNTTNSVTIAAGNRKNIAITITNNSDVSLKYGAYYSVSDLSGVNIGYLATTKNLPNGIIPGNSDYLLTIKVNNHSTSDITIGFGIKYGFENGGDLPLETNEYWFEEYEIEPNKPNLDNGNLIPIYYDDTAEVWKKADETNSDNSWYDYKNKRWANAVIVDTTKKTAYQNATVDTTITDGDIIAFYTWIPRYKYRVWNITRQAGDESTYAYPAYSEGIDIEFEEGPYSTGNVKCKYDVTSAESDTNLSDKCVYKGNDVITTSSGNTNYTDAWYTHPAFTFGNKEIEGFWMGKFETSTTTDSTCYTSPSSDNCNNTDQTPRILPDVSSLRYQTVSNQFTTSKKFQNYLSSGVDAHMLTNLEWGAVAYLSHSIYGLCNGTTCQGMYINNSSGNFTGRSGGAIAGSTDLNLPTVYPDDVDPDESTETTQYNTDGYYTYKGYFIDYNGNVTTTKDTSKIASTTGNITGVYDMSGGSFEYVMGNMVNSSYVFYPSSAGTAWSGTSWYDSTNSALYSKYYNAYSYGTNYYNALAFNRARLGDATAEVLGGTTSYSSWKVGSGITGSYSDFVYSTHSWFHRGGVYEISGSGVFYFSRFNGNLSGISFRSSLS